MKTLDFIVTLAGILAPAAACLFIFWMAGL